MSPLLVTVEAKFACPNCGFVMTFLHTRPKPPLGCPACGRAPLRDEWKRVT